MTLLDYSSIDPPFSSSIAIYTSTAGCVYNYTAICGSGAIACIAHATIDATLIGPAHCTSLTASRQSPALHCAYRPAGSLPIILYLELLCVFAARSMHKRGHAVVRFCPFSSCIVSKRQKIRPYRLLWNANRKPKLRMIPFSMTLMTSKPDLKVTPLSDAEYVRNEMRHYNGMLMRTLHAVDLLLSGMHRR